MVSKNIVNKNLKKMLRNAYILKNYRWRCIRNLVGSFCPKKAYHKQKGPISNDIGSFFLKGGKKGTFIYSFITSKKGLSSSSGNKFLHEYE